MTKEHNNIPTDMVQISLTIVPDNNRQSGLSPTTVPEMSTGIQESLKVKARICQKSKLVHHVYHINYCMDFIDASEKTHL